MSTAIRKLTNGLTRVWESEATSDTLWSGATGLAIGFAKHQMGIDKGAIPVEAVIGAGINYLGSFGPRMVRNVIGERTKAVASAAVTIGMAHVGERLAGGGGGGHHARAHGEFSGDAFGFDSSLAQAAKGL
jgi:hypothetical protein